MHCWPWTDKISETKSKKDILGWENQKQSLADTFEYRCSWKFRKFHRKYRCWSLFFNKVAGLQLFYKWLQRRWLKALLLQNTSGGGSFWKVYLDRPEKGGYTWLVKYMQLFDRAYFFCGLRMSPAVFEEL